MIYKKGTVLMIDHKRKGLFNAEVWDDFDPEMEEWYPLQAVGPINGRHILEKWKPGEAIPCRASLCRIVMVMDLNDGTEVK